MNFVSEQVPIIALFVTIGIFLLVALICVPIIIRRKHTVIKGAKVTHRELHDVMLNVVDALGSRHNILSIEPSLSKIKFRLRDVKLANIERLNEIGASGVVESTDSLTVIFGAISKQLAEEMNK